ncbi:MAG TPA: TetR/AcrR family transcriptional regulator [Solirubrobacteraceae bacterium]|jgi:TetR/AcrR family transcriptional regulator, fatty acid metabolism regulator protein
MAGDRAGAAAADKRRVILDAAVVAFARLGFHQCRVSDIAEEANVSYGLLYHYFRSKDEVLDTLFCERWDILLAFIAQTDTLDVPPRQKLHAIAAAIIDFYRYDPALMKVIIVEVMRSANTFGLRHSDRIAEAYVLIGEIVAKAQAAGSFKREVSPRFAALAFYGAIEQVLTGWIFGMLPEGEDEYEQAKASIVETICGGLDDTGRDTIPAATPESLRG